MNNKISTLTYLCLTAAFLAVGVFIVARYALVGNDHFAAITLNGDASYYRSYGDWLAIEVQDRDIFYHKIGRSIDYARKADIIMLGHSMLMWGLSEDLIKRFEAKHGVRIYNMSFAGVASGEFARRIAKRWGLHPKIWIINADDQAASFFSPALDDFGPWKSTTIETVNYDRFTALQRVCGRNLRWRIGDFLAHIESPSIKKSCFSSENKSIWRSISNGNWNLDKLSIYTNENNPLIKVKRPQDCHAQGDEITYARQYLKEMGGSVVLMLIPSENFCPQRVREIAKELRLETIIPLKTAYPTADGGQHLDKKGARDFTQYLLAELEKTKTFKYIISHPGK